MHPSRHGCSCHCAHGRKTKKDDGQGARHGCPAAAFTEHVTAGIPVQLRFPRRCISRTLRRETYEMETAAARHGRRITSPSFPLLPVSPLVCTLKATRSTSAPPLHPRSTSRRAYPSSYVFPATAFTEHVAAGVSVQLHFLRRCISRTSRRVCPLCHGCLLPLYPRRVMDAACIPRPERLQNPSFFHKYLQNPAGRRIIRRNDHKAPVRVNDKEGIYHGGSCF